MAGEVEVFGIEDRGGTDQTTEDGGLEIIDHDSVRDATEGLEGMFVTGKEVFHGLGDGEFDINHATVGEDHDEEGEATAGLAHGDGGVLSPVDLGAFSGGKVKFEVDRALNRACLTDMVAYQGQTPGIAIFAQALIDLLGSVGMGIEQVGDGSLERVETTISFGRGARDELGTLQPGGHCFAVDAHGVGNLVGIQSLALVQVMELTELFVGNHGQNPPEGIPQTGWEARMSRPSCIR